MDCLKSYFTKVLLNIKMHYVIAKICQIYFQDETDEVLLKHDSNTNNIIRSSPTQ